MATARELLAAQSGEDKILTIDSDLRTIAIPSGFGVFGVESDDDVLRVHFRGPRYYHDVDLSTFNIRVCIHNAKGEPDMFPVEDMTVEEDADTIIFSWLVGRFTAQHRGTIEFSLCFREIDASTGEITREFNTTTASGTILKGLETSEQIVQKNPDILEGIILRLESLEENGIPADSIDTTLSMAGKAADAKAVGDRLAAIPTDNGGGRLLIVTLDENEEYASHSASEINEHINNGGIAVLELGSPMTVFAYPHYRSAGADQVPIAVFSLIEVITDVTQTLYTIGDDKSCAISEETPNYGTGDSGGEVSLIDFSNFENGSFTETVDGEEITHTVTFDDQGRVTAIDNATIVWGSIE